MPLKRKIILELTNCLQETLPGWEAQSRLEPEMRKQMRQQAAEEAKAKESAVLLLMYPKENDLMLVFIQRSEYVGIHSSQIAFPGGRYEDVDIDFEATALRETWEEIGIPPADVTILGKLTSLYVPPSNFNIHPFVGMLSKEPTFILDPLEVAGVFTAPLFIFFNATTLQQKTITFRDGSDILVPCYNVENKIIWGATSMILNELLEVYSIAAAKVGLL